TPTATPTLTNPHAYVANTSTNNVTVFSLDSSGNIAGAGINVAEPAGATDARGITTNPARTRLYVSNGNSANVTVFSLDSSGNIADAGTKVAAPPGARPPRGVATNPATSL